MEARRLMFSLLLSKGLAALVKFGFGEIVNRTFEYIEVKGAQANDRERIRAELTVEAAKAALAEVQIMADLNKSKFQYPWFWLFAAMFIAPLALWWGAVLLDSVFLFPWDVANLPTPEIRQWAGNMIEWLFYVGSGVGVAKMVLK